MPYFFPGQCITSMTIIRCAKLTRASAQPLYSSYPSPLHCLFFNQMRVPLAGHGFIDADAISKAALLSLDHLAWTVTVLYVNTCLTNGRSMSITVVSTQSDTRMLTFLSILGF